MLIRLIINILILVICATALGIILYVMLNFKCILNKSLNTGLAVVKQNDAKIQSILSDLAASVVESPQVTTAINTSIQTAILGAERKLPWDKGSLTDKPDPDIPDIPTI